MWFARDDRVDPVLLHGYERVLLLDVEQFVTFEIAVKEEHGRVKPLIADFEAEQADCFGVVFVTVDELEADDEVE